MRRRILRAAGAALLGLALLLLGAWLIFVPFAKEPGYRFVAAWGEEGTGPGQFRDPTGIAVAGNELCVSDARNGRIQVFDLDGNFLRAFGRPGAGLGELGRPMNLAVHGGELYVPEYSNDRIQVFGLDGTANRVIGQAGSGPGQFNAPGGAAVAPDGTLYVADFYNHRIQRLDSGGRFLRQWGDTGAAGINAGQFGYPTDVALNRRGMLFVADGYNDRVQAFEPDGTFSHKWGGPLALNITGPFNGWFAVSTSIAVGPEGNVIVADFYNHRVQKFAPDGTFLTSFGRRGAGSGEFQYTMAVAVAQDGTVFVTDFANNRVQKWRPQ